MKKFGVFFLVISDDLNPFKIDLDENWPQPQSFVFLTVFKPELAIKPTWLIFFMMICTIYDHTSLRVRTRYPVIKLCNSKLRGWDGVWLTLFLEIEFFFIPSCIWAKILILSWPWNDTRRKFDVFTVRFSKNLLFKCTRTEYKNKMYLF